MAAFADGDLCEARRLQLQSAQLIRRLVGSSSTLLTTAKTIMGMLGVECGPTRAPLVSPSAAQTQQLRDDLERLGFFEYACR